VNVPVGMQNVRAVRAENLKPGVLLRGDAPMDGEPRPEIDSWPPATVIDLRSASELAGGHPLATPGTRVHVEPLAAELNALEADSDDALRTGGLAELYRRTLATAGPATARGARLIANAELPVFVHCAHGKDRTGILVAAILAAIGASREAIIADYIATDPNMATVMDRIAPPGTEVGDKVRSVVAIFPDSIRATADAIEAVLDVFDAAGGAAAWLQQNGLSDDDLARLRERLVTT